ncbi:MAG: SDR family oxidoreductase [Nitrososphaera sp.]
MTRKYLNRLFETTTRVGCISLLSFKLRQSLKPEEIANAVTWLLSEKASFLTGNALIVDGGWVSR